MGKYRKMRDKLNKLLDKQFSFISRKDTSYFFMGVQAMKDELQAILNDWPEKIVEEDMDKSFVHERPRPKGNPPIERMMNLREGPIRKGGINNLPRTPRPKIRPRPQGR
jgi:hypothetical protein